MTTAYNIQAVDKLFGGDWQGSYLVNTILDTKYEEVEVYDFARNQKHLTVIQQNEFENVLAKYTKLFNRTLGVYPRKKFIKIEDKAIPKHPRPYSVPQVHLEA